MRVDLHLHSTASDGVYSPAEVVQIALTNGLDAIALTDHDNTAGIVQAQQAAQSTRLEVLAGVELSSEDEGSDRDLLGYLFDLNNEPLRAMLAELRESRVHRADHIVQKLATLGVDVPLDRVYALAGTGAVGRPHIARAMVEKGYVGSIQDAFDRYLADDGPAYVPLFVLDLPRAIQLLHAAGGVAVLAHPGRYTRYQDTIDKLIPLGLDGIEVYYPDHSPELVDSLRATAAKHGLLMTGGSDFHRRQPDGNARIGTVKIPPELDVISALKERASRYRQ